MEHWLLRPLVVRAMEGDAEAFDSIARHVGDDCMAIAYRILRDVDQADDAVQSALIAAWRDIRSLRDPDRFEPWLHRVLINKCYAEVRRHRRYSANVRLLEQRDHEHADIRGIYDRDQIERAFRRLTLEQRTVLVFHHYVGLTHEQVADRLGIPLGTVKSRIHHATAALRASLEADGRTAIASGERLA